MDQGFRLELVDAPPPRPRWHRGDRRVRPAGAVPDPRWEGPEAAARFIALYRQEFVTLTRMASALVGDWTRAEDIVQTVFADVFRRWETLDAVEPLGGYLNRAVVNQCRSHYRTTARGSRAFPLSMAPTGDDPADAAVARADSVELREALTRLSARQRECVVARFLLEQPESETAAMLNLSIGSVRTHTRRGLLSLQKAMRR